jgi:hypothetical protein
MKLSLVVMTFGFTLKPDIKYMAFFLSREINDNIFGNTYIPVTAINRNLNF